MRSLLVAICLILGAAVAQAEVKPAEYRLGSGDVIRIQVFQNPDLTLETRVSESGYITYPLIGAVAVGGASLVEVETRIARQLGDGGFVLRPQVSVMLLQNRGNQVSVLGQVNRPGRFPIETAGTRLSEMLANAGGIASTGADSVIVVGVRDGKPFRKEIDLPALFLDGRMSEDMTVAGGDVIYVHRAPLFYVYGEVQRPGAFRVERGMTVMQALAQGGGPTVRGSEDRLRLHRRDASGAVVKSSPELSDPIRPDDVLYVRESIF